MERGQTDHIVQQGDLYFLTHPGHDEVFSGYGLTAQPGRIDQLVGLLMVDRPAPVDPAWLAQVEETFGDLSLTPMTDSGERGIACQMRIERDSVRFLQRYPQAMAGDLARALEPLLHHPPNPILKLRWDEEQRIWASRLWVGLPPALQEVFERMGPGCLALPYPRNRGASEREDLVAFVTHAADRDIDSFRGAPVLFRWELLELPAAPVVRFRAAILDDPQAPYVLEHFLNVEDPDQARCLARLVEQDLLAFDFFGDDYEYAYTKVLHHPEDMRADLQGIAARASALLEQIPSAVYDFDRAKAEVQDPAPKFELGHVVATPGALNALQRAQVDPAQLLTRHHVGDWGDLVEEDRQLNDEALLYGGRLFSAYKLPDGTKIWIISEADRSTTTVLLPSDY